jgi:leucyl-tRNA synthetase
MGAVALLSSIHINTYCRRFIMDYLPEVSEPHWQKRWDEAEIFNSQAEPGMPKFYCLEMYPYPSGKMHMGHVRNYSIGDAVARFKRAMGFNVIYPMGFDSFGMPAENAAIAEGGHPRDITERNMSSITSQIKRMGFSYDWKRQIKSHDPGYYKWNQWAFLKFLEKGLAYREHAPVNWCTDCVTVLANEQVKNGRCWRCGSEVMQKDMSQWFLRITDYAEELLSGLEEIEFPENVKLLQQDWLGRSEGAEIVFGVENLPDEEIRVFTTRPDTLFGATFVTLAPEHPLCEVLASGGENESQWRELRDEVVRMSDFDREKVLKEKKGVFLGKYAIHPLTGDRVPIWAGNFVIASYGTGAVMAVPAHDERDFEFAKRYGIPIKKVLLASEDEGADEELKTAFTGLGWMVNSGREGFDGTYGKAAKHAIIDALENEDNGKGTIQWKLRPWLISRQRYWGTPIPIIHCSDCGPVPVPVEQLPVELPDDVSFSGHGNPLETSSTFCEVDCPSCGKDARRETDTMDTFVDSSWYFMRYSDALNDAECFSKDIADYWMNVDFYCGGIEHAQMHLIYARFWTKALRDIGLLSASEPFQTLLCQGMVNAPAPWCDVCSVTLNVEHRSSPCPHCGNELSERSAKMSKSLGNTVSPEDMIARFGADTVRLFILFAAQPTAGMDWSDTAVEANHRQVSQLHDISSSVLAWDGEASVMDDWMRARLKQRYHEWTQAMGIYDLRRAVEISHYDLIKDLNWYQRRGGNNPEIGKWLLSHWSHMLQLATPHLAEEWWQQLGNDDLLAGRIHEGMDKMTDQDVNAIDSETFLRMVLDDARERKQLAMRHLESPPTRLVLQTADDWKVDLAVSGIRFQQDGGDIKQFQKVIEAKPYAQEGEMRGQVITLWRKRMMPMVFKWSPLHKGLLLNGLDEAAVINSTKEFISEELEVELVECWQAGSGEDAGGKAGSAFPLKPSLLYE